MVQGSDISHMTLGAGCSNHARFFWEPERRLFLGMAVILFLTLLAYWRVFPADFIWDDDAYVINNNCLRSFGGLSSIWFQPGATPQYYPMVFTLLWAQFQLWGLDPIGYHLVNILLHGINGVLLWLCLRKIKVPAAFWGAALFALHPVQVESVAWITELKNVLSLFFYLLSLLGYLHYAGADGNEPAYRQKYQYGLSLLFFLLALFSKTVSGSLPAAILLIRWWQTGHVRRREVLSLLPFFVLAVILGRQTARLEVTHVLAQGPEWAFSFADRLLIAGRATWFYAGKLFWPYPLSFNYQRWTIDSGAWWQYLFPLTLVAVLVCLWSLRQRIGRGPLAAVLFFIGTLFPALGFFNVYPMRFSFVADHFQYIASIGIIVLFCATVRVLRKWLLPKADWAESAVFSVILLIFAVLTLQQGKIYQDNLTLFTDTIGKNPGSWFGYANRGTHYANAGMDDLAMADLEKALQIKPDEADALHMRGVLLLKKRDFAGAFADFDRSIALRPWRTDYYKNRAIALRFAGRLDKALVDASTVIDREPEAVDNYLLRASIYAMQEAYARALRDLDLALKIDPGDFRIFTDRGLVYYRKGLLNNAIDDFNVAVKLRPDSSETYFNRGLAYAAAGSAIRSRSDLLKAKELGYRIERADIEKILSTVGKRQPL